jgi:hypothetical protein
MSTYAQWRSPGSRTETVRPTGELRKYDIRLVDQFYTYCQAVHRTDRHRAAAARLQQVTKRGIWKLIVAGGLLSYYLVERVAQAMSLF